MNQQNYTPLYEKDIKENQNKPMETTIIVHTTMHTILQKIDLLSAQAD